ncbi:MAG: squalene/phytoene synthase family protein [Thiocapsa sp.]|nr:squalene/phytoene synthase family protein [Thiocapsa sp.]MCG6985321.1 squalene/phytoene synthase family protein [Thiocapsa sp.]
MRPRPARAEWGFPNSATPPGSTAYYSLRFAPSRLRDDLAVLLAWRYLVRSVADQVSDPGVAARKLEWWHHELERIFKGVGSHPLARPLGRLVTRAELPPQPFIDVIWATEAILTGRRANETEDLVAWADRDLGALFELIVRVHGQGRAVPAASARGAGAYCALVELFRESGRLLRQGRRHFLPWDRASSLGSSRSDLRAAGHRERLAPLLGDLFPEVTRYRATLDADFGLLPTAIRVRVRLADRLLAELAASGFRVADQRISLTPIRKLWNAWRESRRPGVE